MRSPRPAFDAAALAPPFGQAVVGWWRSLWSAGDQTQAAVFFSALLLLVVSTLCGGASQGNAAPLACVEVASLPLLFVSLYLVMVGAAPRAAIVSLLLLAAVVLVPLAQLIPLPPGVWTQLPGRGELAQVLDALKLGRPAEPFSLAPEQTWCCAMALAPPAAMFMGGLFLTDAQRRVMVVCWLVLAVVSLGIGGLQLLQGADSPLYFYAITNPDSAVGLFSNRNHEAALLYCLLPMAAVFAAEFRGAFEDRRALGPLLAALYIFVAIAGVAVTRSRAGIALTGVGLLGAAAVALRGGVLGRRWRAVAGIGAVSALAIGAVLVLNLGPILQRFGSGGEPRFTGWPIVIHAAQGFLPLGSGVGSFETVYRTVEPLTDVSPIYFNHAHNDYLEVWLETGVAGAALFALFVVWLATRLAAIWVRPSGEGASLAAAASLLVLMLLAHEAVDYPLRPETIAVLFAFACATITVYRPRPAGAAPPAPQRHRRRRSRTED
ncbi:MAG TPA: O-antigen ligase family protein [Caulobacteraceae bacterium]|jgi:O-antigen ligase